MSKSKIWPLFLLKDTSKHISCTQLEEEDKFLRLFPVRKRLMDTIRRIYKKNRTVQSLVCQTKKHLHLTYIVRYNVQKTS
jgi:hypothetical protein